MNLGIITSFDTALQLGPQTLRGGLDAPPRHRYGRRQSAHLITPEADRLRTIYKICPASVWREAERQGVYRGSADDIRDGFMHFSTATQLPGTLEKHYRGESALFLIAVDADALGAALRFEPSRGGDLFPHLHGELDLGDVLHIYELRTRADGSHELPELPP